MPRYKMLLEYEGTNYSGWQVQKGDTSVQELVERALATALRSPTSIVGSGRTDAGVHARGQVAHFDARDPVDEHRLTGSINGLLPDDIAVHAIGRVDDSFHARYNASSRLYRYYVATHATALERRFRVRIPSTTRFDLMNDTAAGLQTRTDFSSFCRTQSETRNRICEVMRAVWLPEGDGLYYFEIQANRFLHGMVRAIVGTLLEIGRGHRPAEDVPRILEERDRRAAGPAAPAYGLVLEKVFYPTPEVEYNSTSMP
ncbi:MAG: tRNA pseudouridine(38-40) synthase TruA [Rhodothermales bacterium]|nr:tRNA pseudouridine(38-40) synthase TruA [Rhodothermales bacterium]